MVVHINSEVDSTYKFFSPNIVMQRLIEPFEKIQKTLGDKVPLDGLAVVLYAYTMPYSEADRFRNTMILGGLHWFLHEMVTCPHPKKDIHKSFGLVL